MCPAMKIEPPLALPRATSNSLIISPAAAQTPKPHQTLVEKAKLAQGQIYLPPRSCQPNGL